MAQTSITSFFKIIKKNAEIKKEKPITSFFKIIKKNVENKRQKSENDPSFKNTEKEHPGVRNGENIKQSPKIEESPSTSIMDPSFKDTAKEQLAVQNENTKRFPKKEWLDSSSIKQSPEKKEGPSTPDTSFDNTEKEQLAVQNENAMRFPKTEWLDSSRIKQSPKIKKCPSTSMMDTSFEDSEQIGLPAVQNGNVKTLPKKEWWKESPSTSMKDTFEDTDKKRPADQNRNAKKRSPKRQWLDSSSIKRAPKMKKSPSTSVTDTSFEDTDNVQPAVRNGSTKNSSKRRLDFSSNKLQTTQKKIPSTPVKMRHPSSTPEMATPKRAASRVPRTPKKPRILTPSQFCNSGSELEGSESDMEDEGGDQLDPVNMREVVRQLRRVAIMEDEGDMETLAILEQGFDVPIVDREEVVETWEVRVDEGGETGAEVTPDTFTRSEDFSTYLGQERRVAILEGGVDVSIVERKKGVETWEVIELEFGEAGTEGPDASISWSADISKFLGQERRVAIMEKEGDMALAVLEQGSDVPIVEWKEVMETSEVREVKESGEAGTEVPDASFSWTEDFSTFLGQEEMYTRDPGPRIPTADILGTFMAIWDLSIFTTIVEQTNLYAWQTIARMSELGPLPKYLDAWVDTNVYEIARLFGVLIYMSLNYRACVKEYWATGPLGMPDFRKFMSRNRFQLLMRFLHFTDNDNVQIGMTSYQKKIAKIAPIVEHMNRKFAEIYVPQRELSLDESLLLWKGRMSWVQCIRSKAARFGIKLFELCEAATGYLIRSIIYAGKDSSFVEGALHGFDNKTAKVVLELMDGFLDVGHLLVMDNWYNQLVLTRYLKSRHTDVLGTINKNRQHIPNSIKNANENKMKRGQRISRHCGDISVTAWKDVKLVTVMSTCHGDELIVGSRAKQEHIKPAAVDKYNQTMGGVDLKDMKLSGYLMERKRGRKWYIKVFAHYLNTSILNSFIIYSKNPSTTVVSHRAFRYALADSLVKIGQPIAVPRPIIDVTSVRLDRQPDHYPTHTDCVEGKAVKHQRLRCKRCTAAGKRTSVMSMCQKCCVALCLGQCWIDYHTKVELK